MIFMPKHSEQTSQHYILERFEEAWAVLELAAGENNAYGHPSPNALALYESVGANIYRTD